MAITTAQIQQLYVAYLGRAADKAGLDYWSAQLNAVPATLTLDNLRANFVSSQKEYTDAYGGLSRTDTVIKIYNNLFGRAPDADGLAYWSTGGGATVSSDLLLTAFIAGASTADSQVVANKVLVAEVYTSTAGTQYLNADAKSVISGVDGTTASITAAFTKLTDGSLSGIAVPAGVAALKAGFIAKAAADSFETSKVTDLTAISKELATLSTTGDKAGLIGDTTASTGTTYAAVSTDLQAAISTARTGLDTKALTTSVATETTALADARTAYLTDKTLTSAEQTSALTNINNYDAAVKAVAANTAANAADVTQAKATFSAYSTNANNTAAFTAAVKAAGLADNSTSADVYAALASATTTDANIAKIVNAFAGVSSFASVKTLAAQDHSANVAQASLTTATKAITDVGGAATTTNTADSFKTAYDALASDTAKLAASKAVDAVVAKFTAIDTAHTSVVKASTDAQTAVSSNTTLVTVANSAGVDTKADVFHFAAAKPTSAEDFKINFGAKDSLYIGDGYTLNTTATLDATGIKGANNSALEVFFFKDATSGNIKAVVETAAEGNTTVTGNTLAASTADKVAIIELSGVTDVSQISFANGVIAHV